MAKKAITLISEQLVAMVIITLRTSSEMNELLSIDFFSNLVIADSMCISNSLLNAHDISFRVIRAFLHRPLRRFSVSLITSMKKALELVFFRRG